MPNNAIRSFFIFQIFLMIAVLPCSAGKEDVYFRNKTDGSIKKNCFRIQGRHDAFPVLKCMDENGVASEFEPGDVWEEVEIIPLCFEYTGNDPAIGKGTVRGRCVKIAGKENPEPLYRCFDEEMNQTDFDPGADWREIPMTDERCKAFAWKDVLRGGGTEKKYVEVQVFYGTDRKRSGSPKPAKFYGGDRGKLEYGKCKVSIPEDHRMGKLESPLWKKYKQNPEKHVVLLSVNPQGKELFFGELKKEMQQAKGRQALVFVHGFNVTFEDAARRTAQMAYDLQFAGLPLFYSWPSEGDMKKYVVDETNVRWTVPHLKNFLEDVALQTGAEDIFLIAHSMGNRALTAALGLFADDVEKGRNEKTVSGFKEIILAAPDIDAEIFKRDIAPALLRLGAGVTLYASSEDMALKASETLHKYPRAGDTDNGVIPVPGIHFIDVSDVDTSFMEHSYYGDNVSVITDIFYLLRGLKKPSERSNLKNMKKGSRVYWKFGKVK